MSYHPTAHDQIKADINNYGLAPVLAAIGSNIAAIVNRKKKANVPFADGSEANFRKACLDAIRSTIRDRAAQ